MDRKNHVITFGRKNVDKMKVHVVRGDRTNDSTVVTVRHRNKDKLHYVL